jgi:hypothetical protein
LELTIQGSVADVVFLALPAETGNNWNMLLGWKNKENVNLGELFGI